MKTVDRMRLGLLGLSVCAAGLMPAAAAWAQEDSVTLSRPDAPAGVLDGAMGFDDAPEPDPASLAASKVMRELMTSDDNVSLEKLSQYQDFLLRLDLAVQINEKLSALRELQAKATPEAPAQTVGTASGSMLVPQMPPRSAATAPMPPSPPPPSGTTTATLPRGNAGMDTADVMPPEGLDYNLERLFGTNGSYSAYLRTSGGSRILVKTGDRLPGGATVERVTKNSVTLKPEDGEAEELRFGPLDEEPMDDIGSAAGGSSRTRS